jgi:hypothetical protein
MAKKNQGNGVVYFIELERPIGTDAQQARTYIGYADDGDWERRLNEHRSGVGAKMLAYAASIGIAFNVVCITRGSGKIERGLKNRGSGSRTLAAIRAGRAPKTVTYTGRNGKETLNVNEFTFVQ